MTGRIRDLILDSDKTHLIHEMVADGSFYGMQTFDQALLGLYRSGLVDLQHVRDAATSSHDLEIALRAEGLQPA